MSPLARLALRLLDAYQARGGGRTLFWVECNFEPTCSQYAKVAIRRFGFLRGARLAASRLRRCRHPDLVTPMADPVPESDG